MGRFVDSVLAGLTLEEKLGQLTQNVLSAAITGPQLPEASTADIRAGRIGSFLGVSGAEVTRNLQRVAMVSVRPKFLNRAWDWSWGAPSQRAAILRRIRAGRPVWKAINRPDKMTG